MNKEKLKGVSLKDLRAEFEADHRPNLVAMKNGSGRGREGLEDGWYNGLSMYRPTYLGPALSLAIEQIVKTDIVQVMVNRLKPYGRLSKHIDGPPYDIRYHLPIISGGTDFYEEGEHTIMQEGYWYGPVSYWLEHEARNDTDSERVHIIVDQVKEQ